LFVLLFVSYLIRDIIKPLGKLVMFTRVYEPGQRLPFDTSQPRQRTDEFGLLYQAFIRMTQRLDQSIEENYGMKIKQKEQELSALHSQITPHLLYNTLDSIYWYALGSGNQDVGTMVKDLSKLLRIGLSKGKSIITVSEELEHVQAYIRLQMKRYPGVFEVFWDIDEGVESCTVPKVVIQPLVENAIFHGVQSMDGEGQLWIRVKRREKELLILVEDNGFIPVDLEKLRQIVDGTLRDKGYGIRNVHQRIQLHYGEAYGLEYRLRPEGGLTAVIMVPVQTGE
jgi:two-component system sensor histidine kinase YesM